MQPKLLALLLTIGFGGACIVSAQETTPTPSPSPAKHRSHKKTEAATAASPAAEASASPAAAAGTEASPAGKKKRSHKAKMAPEASPAETAAAAGASTEAAASASPAGKKMRHHRKTEAAAMTAPEMTPSPTPKKSLFNIFKPKPSPSMSPGMATTGEAAHEVAARATPEPGGGNGLVWVNTETHIYHKEGSRFYGKTKKGKYMTEAEAMKEGAKESKKEIGAKTH